MIILVIALLGIALLKREKEMDVYECVGSYISKYLKLNYKIKDYKTMRYLRHLNSKEEFESNKATFINYKLSSATASVVLLFYCIKLHSRISATGWVYAIGFLVYLIYLPEIKLNEKVKKQKNIIKNKLPNFLMKLNLLMGSGMSSVTAIRKISTSKRDCLEKLLFKAILDIEAGQSIEDSFHEVALQCQDVYITQFARIVIQDKKYGTKETIRNLEAVCTEVWKNKKTEILKKGEEASTKLLLPMMIALVSILIAVTVPALSQLFQVK